MATSNFVKVTVSTLLSVVLMTACSVGVEDQQGSSSSSTTSVTATVEQKVFVDSTLYHSPRMIVGTEDSFTPDQLGGGNGTLGQNCWGGDNGTEGWCSSPELACRTSDHKCWCDCTSGSLLLGSSPCTQMCEHTSCMIQNLEVKEGEAFQFGHLEVTTNSDVLTSQYLDPKEGWVDLGVWNCMPFRLGQKCDSEKGGCAQGLECVGEPGNQTCQCSCGVGDECHDSEFSLPSMTQDDVTACTATCEKQLCGFEVMNHKSSTSNNPLANLTPKFLTCKQGLDPLHWQYECLVKTEYVEFASSKPLHISHR